jgi:hypothetical protein
VLSSLLIPLKLKIYRYAYSYGNFLKILEGYFEGTDIGGLYLYYQGLNSRQEILEECRRADLYDCPPEDVVFVCQMGLNSTLLFLDLFSSESLGTIGLLKPKPFTFRRSGATPLPTRYFLTESARL